MGKKLSDGVFLFFSFSVIIIVVSGGYGTSRVGVVLTAGPRVIIPATWL